VPTKKKRGYQGQCRAIRSDAESDDGRDAVSANRGSIGEEEVRDENDQRISAYSASLSAEST